ncbi:MAG: ABC transporter permease [Ruminococcaceae bacterium]|nr:ABC transporter permease [Oscillospiraceae bacterium]
MFENLRFAFDSVKGHKLRSLLTMLGIIIGIASIITIVSTIKGTNEQIKENLIGAGTNCVVVRLNENDYPFDAAYQPNPDGVKLISEEDRLAITELSGVEEATVFNIREWCEGVFYRNTAFNGKIVGVDEHYMSVYSNVVVRGRGFVEKDFTETRRVVVIDNQVADNLFGREDPLGCTIEIAGEPFTVIGVVSRSSDFKPVITSINDYYMYTDTSGGSMYVPNRMWGLIYKFDEPQCVAVRAASTDAMTTAGQKTADYLNDNNIGDVGERQLTFKSEDLLEQAQQLQSMSSSTNRQLVWIASISLLVGGIGVMNIMLVSVTERTSEIGLKKAIGAKKKRILGQFLTEAAVITCIGGFAGVLAGVVLALLLSQIMSVPVSISVSYSLIAVVFSIVIGVAFGLFPAIKAANLNPIEALRRD